MVAVAVAVGSSVAVGVLDGAGEAVAVGAGKSVGLGVFVAVGAAVAVLAAVGDGAVAGKGGMRVGAGVDAQAAKISTIPKMGYLSVRIMLHPLLSSQTSRLHKPGYKRWHHMAPLYSQPHMRHRAN